MKLLLFVFLPILTFGQKVFTGSVLNAETKEGIPYATIGFVKKNTGTNADKEGNFRLNATMYSDDSLIISCIGYHTLIISVTELPVNMRIELKEKQLFLNEVIIHTQSKRETVTLNEFSNCGMNYYVSTGYITQIAQRFKSPVNNALLSEIHICKQSSNSLFRIRIYSMDSVSGKPLADLADTIIEVESSQRNVHLNLEEYKIVIPRADFFVAIEWVYLPLNEYKIKTKFNGKKIIYSKYYPAISVNDRKSDDQTLDSKEVWVLNFNGKWDPIIPRHAHMLFLISAKLKY